MFKRINLVNILITLTGISFIYNSVNNNIGMAIAMGVFVILFLSTKSAVNEKNELQRDKDKLKDFEKYIEDKVNGEFRIRDFKESLFKESIK